MSFEDFTEDRYEDALDDVRREIKSVHWRRGVRSIVRPFEPAHHVNAMIVVVETSELGTNGV